MTYSIEKVTTLIGARRYGTKNAQIGFILTDSRSLCFPEETLFFALVTERNNGHHYIPELYQRGVRNFVVSAVPVGYDKLYPEANFLKVVDTRKALQRLAERRRDEFDIPIIGVIEPGAKVAAAQTRNKRVGIIGTVGTVGSGIHAEYLKHLDPEITVFGKACPLFVPLVEEGWLHDPVTDEVAARYLKELQDKQVDTLILGCTHYPLLRSTIRKIMGDGVCLVNPAYETALELGRLLEEKGLAGEGTEKNEFPYRFYVSDLADEFKAFANSILPYDVEMTKKIDIEKY